MAQKVIFFLWFLWQLPQNIVALVMMPFIGKLTLKCYRNYCYCFIASDLTGGSISLGNFAFICENHKDDEPTVSHEVDGHTKQSKILGPLYVFVIGIPSLLWAYFRNPRKQPNYYTFYTESWANKCAGLIVKYKNYRYVLDFKDKA